MPYSDYGSHIEDLNFYLVFWFSFIFKLLRFPIPLLHQGPHNLGSKEKEEMFVDRSIDIHISINSENMHKTLAS